MNALDLLKERGFVKQITFEDDLYKAFDEGMVPFYIGFDPTADSLHIGHYIPIMAMAHLQKAGHKPYALMGGGTGMIGDPSGKSDLRKVLTVEDIDSNVAHIRKQMERFLDFDESRENCAVIVNNADWLRDLNFLDFMREIGSQFNVNEMLRARCYVNRMQTGLSFLEFSYMLMQSYDFYRLYQDYGCQMQFGGDDQWSNMLGGINLIRKKLSKDAYALTINLLLKHDGTKMGKTAGGAVWLDPDKYAPYDFYQYWRNVDDADVLKFLRMMTFLPLEQIDEMDKWEGSQLNTAKSILAYELTSLVHGEDEAKKAEAGAKAVFMGSGSLDTVPSVELSAEDFNENDGIDIISLLVKTGQAASRSEGRRAITKDHSISVGDSKIDDFTYEVKKQDIPEEGLLIKKGKKNIRKVVLADK